ncbi:MAG: hypothetical protein MZW92_09045 [Comamonadaceae bacterium]|nr:hypothetical protein [Comamonadaceae bacterium]
MTRLSACTRSPPRLQLRPAEHRQPRWHRTRRAGRWPRHRRPAGLERYEQTQRRATRPLYLATQLITQIYTRDTPPARALRNWRCTWASASPCSSA